MLTNEDEKKISPQRTHPLYVWITDGHFTIGFVYKLIEKEEHIYRKTAEDSIQSELKSATMKHVLSNPINSNHIYTTKASYGEQELRNSRPFPH